MPIVEDIEASLRNIPHAEVERSDELGNRVRDYLVVVQPNDDLDENCYLTGWVVGDCLSQRVMRFAAEIGEAVKATRHWYDYLDGECIEAPDARAVVFVLPTTAPASSSAG